MSVNPPEDELHSTIIILNAVYATDFLFFFSFFFSVPFSFFYLPFSFFENFDNVYPRERPIHVPFSLFFNPQGDNKG